METEGTSLGEDASNTSTNNSSQTSNDQGSAVLAAAASQGDEFDELIREQDRFLPIANIGRIMKNTLPGNAKIAKDAKETLQECLSEFIAFITSEASDKCLEEKRKTINGDDLLWALTKLGFDNYVEPLKVYLLKYRESIKLAGPNQSRGGPRPLLLEQE